MKLIFLGSIIMGFGLIISLIDALNNFNLNSLYYLIPVGFGYWVIFIGYLKEISTILVKR